MMTQDDLRAEIERLDDAIAKNMVVFIRQECSGLHALDWTPLLVAAAVFWAALG